jgi:hypothetical protein
VVKRFGSKKGSAMVESCLVMALLCLILFGILQVSYLVASRNVINYSAVATARAASVGLNDFMLHKVSHYTAIPAAGPVETPLGFSGERPAGESTGALFSNALARKNNPRSELGAYEVAVREAYHLAPVNGYKLILDYDNWQREDTDVFYTVEEDPKFPMLHVTVEQNIPLALPFSGLFFSHLQTVRAERGRGDVSTYPAKWMEAKTTIEDHSRLYFGNRD